MRTPELLDRGQPARGLLGVAHEGRLGDLDRQRRRRHRARCGERLRDIVDELVGVELARGDVDGHADRMAGAAPDGALRRQACLSTQLPTSTDQAGLLEQGDEVVGLDDAAPGVPPADAAPPCPVGTISRRSKVGW